MILGVDLGNWNCKDSLKNVYGSRYSTKENLLGHKGDVLEVDGVLYYMGDGKLENNYDKASKETNIVLLLYMLAKCKADNFNLVVGLPTLQYKENRDRFRSKLLENRLYQVKINGESKTIIFDDLIVFPEGAGAYYSLDDKPKNAVIIDVGGGTTNVVEFKNGKLNECTTLGKGMIQIYREIREHLNSTYTLSLELEDIENILKDGLCVEGEKVDFKFLKSIVDDYISLLMNELRNYPIRTCKVLLTGGGSLLLKTSLKAKMKGLEVIEDYLFSNVNGFYKVGVAKWQKD